MAAQMKPKVLVTGGSRGIGLAIVERFLAGGFDVLACARGQGALDALKSRHPSVDCMVCDLADADAVERLAETVAARHCALDALVNNAGAYLPGQTHDEAEGALETMLHANLMGAYRLTRKVLPAMMARRSGTVAAISAKTSGFPSRAMGVAVMPGERALTRMPCSASS